MEHKIKVNNTMEQINDQLGASSSDKWLLSQGQVVGVEGGFVLVKTQRQSACGGCQSESGCGTSALAKLFSNTGSAPIKVSNTLQAALGDQVILKLDESRLVLHAFMAYGLPLIGLFVGAIFFKSAGLSVLDLTDSSAELTSILGGFIGLVSGWFFTKRFYKPTMPVLEKVLK